MFRNYLKIALRNLAKHKAYTVINIVGLAVGIACCVLMLLWVYDEVTFDHYHAKKDRIYRVLNDITFASTVSPSAVTSPPMGPALEADFPEVEQAIRFGGSFGAELRNPDQDSPHQENGNFFWVDPDVFEVFSWELLQGDPQTALIDPATMVISERRAKVYFGDENPIGKTVIAITPIPGRAEERTYTITGVMKDVPRNSHLRPDFLASYTSLDPFIPDILADWNFHFQNTYVLLAPGASEAQLEGKLRDFIFRHAGEHDFAETIHLHLQPLKEVYLRSQGIQFNVAATGNMVFITIFSLIALAILSIACINFMNLATARSMERAKEVGIKKVMGAHRGQLIWQFLSESIVLNIFAVILAVALIELALPGFNAFTGKELAIDYLHNPYILPGLGLLAVMVGLFSGMYPAFFLSAFRPVIVLKGKFINNPASSILRKSLIIGQFSISIILMISTGIIYQQLEYLRHKDLGFDTDQVYIVPLRGAQINQNREAFKARLQQESGIEAVSLSAGGFGFGGAPQFGFRADGQTDDEMQMISSTLGDPDLVRTLGLELVAGREFSPNAGSDTAAVLINESSLAQFGWSSPEEALNQRVFWEYGDAFEVVGVVKDFHFAPLRQVIAPLVIRNHKSYQVAMIRVSGGDIPATLASIKSIWNEFVSDKPFQGSFLSTNLETLYQGERALGQISTTFSILAILIACLGLFGLAAFSAEKRTKEIGVRKVLGASLADIIVLLSKEFTTLILIANLAAFPAAYFLMRSWLQTFAYQIDISLFVFLAAAAAAFLIAILTVSFQAVRAALTNPISALRYE